MAAKKSSFDKVLNAWDVLVIAFGAMIGWAWVVSTGDWITGGGVLGAMLGFAIGGVMIFFVGLTYAELTSAMPQCGGEHVFSYKAMGPVGSFICTWMIVLGYVSVVCFEACALPTILVYLFPDFLMGYLYTIGGFDIYATWLAAAVIIAVAITAINIIGAKTAARLQTILTAIIGGVGIVFVAASVLTGSTANLDGQLFMGATTSEMAKGTLAIAVMTPFYFIGFDVIPQAAEEISVSLQKIGRILILSIVALFFGRKMLVWVVDAGNFGCCMAYCMVSISFLILRKKAPDMVRPYKVRHYKFVGAMAVLMSAFMVVMYIVPGSGAALAPQEWGMVAG